MDGLCLEILVTNSNVNLFPMKISEGFDAIK